MTIPSYGAIQLLRRAVDSILAQTHRNLTLLVINDGNPTPLWPALADIDDARLVRFDMDTNRGRYFADGVAIAATDAPYYLIQDADDWSEPRRIERLLACLQGGAYNGAMSAFRNYHRSSGSYQDIHFSQISLSREFKHRITHYCLYRTEALRAIGGYYGGFRIADDTMIMNLQLMTGKIAISDEVLYHRQYRGDSLEHAPATGICSPERCRVHDLLRKSYADIYSVYLQSKGDAAEREKLCAHIRQVRRRHVSSHDIKALEQAAKDLAAILGGGKTQPLTVTTEVASPPRPETKADPARANRSSSELEPRPTARQLLYDPRLRWTGWSMTRLSAGHLCDRLEALKPMRILELGSGTTTAMLAAFAAETGAKLVTLEHKPNFLEKTRNLLASLNLADAVDLCLAPLAPFRHKNTEWMFYDRVPPGPYDFVLIDGPPKNVGRQAGLFGIRPELAPRWEIWFDDGARDHEKECIALWQRHFDFEATYLEWDVKGSFQLRSHP
ncbi:MAG TPA: glycosyltransferase [Verrucomicrobiales bacterium]|nr:glycosyltransferase [Verrucomicrobiales bacterium]